LWKAATLHGRKRLLLTFPTRKELLGLDEFFDETENHAPFEKRRAAREFRDFHFFS
jgi:hypothetical protein